MGLEVDGTAGVGYDGGGDFEGEGVEDRVEDAVVGGDTDEGEGCDVALVEIVGEAGVAEMGVVEECAVAVDGGIGTFVEDVGDFGGVEGEDEVGAGGVLHAVGGPEDLGAVGGDDGVAGFFVGMGGGEADVVRRMPVFGGEDVREEGDEAVDEGWELVGAGSGKGAGGHEVVLHVDDQEGFHVFILLMSCSFLS